MVHGDAREGKWRGNWRMEWVASTLYTTSEHGLSSTTTADAHTSVASSRLNWHPRRFKWTRPFRRKTKYGFCACAITFQLASTDYPGSVPSVPIYSCLIPYFMYIYCYVYVFLLCVYVSSSCQMALFGYPDCWGFSCFFLSCKANARVNPAKTGHGPHSSKIFVLFYVLFVLCRSMYCFCVNVYCTTATVWLPNCG